MLKFLTLVNLLLIFSTPVFAEEAVTPQMPASQLVEIKWRGFANLVALQDFSDHYFLQQDKETNFTKHSAVGLQATAQVAPNMQFVSQVLGKGSNNFDANFDWILLRYSPSEMFNVLIGKQKYPIWMASDRLDVGYTYPWLLPPLTVYGAEPLRNFTGVLIETTVYRSAESLREVVLEIYGGNAEINVESRSTSIGIADIETKGGLSHLRGVNLIYRDENLNFRLGYSALQSNIDILIHSASGTVFLPGLGIPLSNIQTGSLALHGDYELYTAGLEINSAKYLLMAEYARTRFAWENSFGVQADPTDSYYVTVGQRFEKLTPYYTYSKLDTKSHASRYEIQSLGTNYTVNDHSKVKAEVQRVQVLNGTSPYATPPTVPEWVFGAGLTAVF